MSDDKRTANTGESAPSGKAYSAPKLTEFGPVGALTQGGSRGGPEANPQTKQVMG